MVEWDCTCQRVVEWDDTCQRVVEWDGTCQRVAEWGGTCQRVVEWDGTCRRVVEWGGTGLPEWSSHRYSAGNMMGSVTLLLSSISDMMYSLFQK